MYNAHKSKKMILKDSIQFYYGHIGLVLGSEPLAQETWTS